MTFPEQDNKGETTNKNNTLYNNKTIARIISAVAPL
jgi:hypothetical protein